MTTLPEFTDFLGKIVAAFGGTEALAKELYDTYLAAKAGGAGRIQLMMKISDMILRGTQHFGVAEKFDEMSDDELVSALNQYFKQVTVISGPAAATDDAAGAPPGP